MIILDPLFTDLRVLHGSIKLVSAGSLSDFTMMSTNSNPISLSHFVIVGHEHVVQKDFWNLSLSCLATVLISPPSLDAMSAPTAVRNSRRIPVSKLFAFHAPFRFVMTNLFFYASLVQSTSCAKHAIRTSSTLCHSANRDAWQNRQNTPLKPMKGTARLRRAHGCGKPCGRKRVIGDNEAHVFGTTMRNNHGARKWGPEELNSQSNAGDVARTRRQTSHKKLDFGTKLNLAFGTRGCRCRCSSKSGPPPCQS